MGMGGFTWHQISKQLGIPSKDFRDVRQEIWKTAPTESVECVEMKVRALYSSWVGDYRRFITKGKIYEALNIRIGNGRINFDFIDDEGDQLRGCVDEDKTSWEIEPEWAWKYCQRFGVLPSENVIKALGETES